MAAEYCDRCQTKVTTSNCSITMHAIAWGEPYVGLLSRRRCIRCSPSRAQHIVHPTFYPPIKDDREAYDKRLFDDAKALLFEAKWTAAWLMCQQPKIADAWMLKLQRERERLLSEV